MLDFLKATYQRLISELDIKTHRYLYDEFHIKNRLTGIIGPRGVGKTTLILQYIKEHLYNNKQVFYFSADNIYFNKVSILEFVENLYHSEGIVIFFIDEIHKYKNWSQELKNIYDAFPKIKIIFSGSSSINLIEGSHDLSRRAKLFTLHGLSLREYINFKTKSKLESISLSELLVNYQKYDELFTQIPKIKGHFNNYLAVGYYPFIFEDPHSYYEKIARIVEKTIYEDIANYYNLKTVNLIYFKKILNFLASIPPGNVNTHNLANNLSIDNKTVSHYLKILNDTGLIRLIYPYEGGNQSLRKPEKIFLNNTTLLYALNNYIGQGVDKGTERELFFVQSFMDSGHDIFYSKNGDFRRKDIIFEIGGKNKTSTQIKDRRYKGILVKDDILVSSKNVIPLLYFGFLY
jgi:predicted AAA+ superfamily ATPase